MPESQSPIVVRPARGPDIRPLAELIAPFVEQKILLPRTVDELALLLPNYFVAEDGGRIVGLRRAGDLFQQAGRTAEPGRHAGISGTGSRQTAGRSLRQPGPRRAGSGSDGDHVVGRVFPDAAGSTSRCPEKRKRCSCRRGRHELSSGRSVIGRPETVLAGPTLRPRFATRLLVGFETRRTGRIFRGSLHCLFLFCRPKVLVGELEKDLPVARRHRVFPGADIIAQR